MPSKGAPVVRGSDKAKTGREARSKPGQTSYIPRKPAAVPKWTVSDYKPPRKISDKELEAARKMFFELDRDGSGSIDAEELGMMLRSLGQNPTEEELKDLIDSVDEGDKDGQIQLREFLKLYTQSLDQKKTGAAGTEDVANVYYAFGGDPSNPAGSITAQDLKDKLLEFYDLVIDPSEVAKGDTFTQADMTPFLTEAPVA